MKRILLGLIVCLLGIAAGAQTNFEVLHTASLDYSNATIIRTSPAYAVVMYNDGIAKVPWTNLPITLQKQFGYSPAAAAAFAIQEKQKHIAELQAKNDYARKMASLRGTNRLVQVTSVIDEFGQCTISCPTASGRVYLIGLPASVNAFYTRREELQNAIADLKNTPITVSETVKDPNDPDPAFTARLAVQNALENAKDARADKLGEAKEELSDLNATATESTTVWAYPTGLTYAGLPEWKTAQ